MSSKTVLLPASFRGRATCRKPVFLTVTATEGGPKKGLPLLLLNKVRLFTLANSMISASLLFLSAIGLGQSCRHCPLIRLHYDSIVCPCHTRQSSLRLIPGTEPTRTLPTCRHQ